LNGRRKIMPKRDPEKLRRSVEGLVVSGERLMELAAERVTSFGCFSMDEWWLVEAITKAKIDIQSPARIEAAIKEFEDGWKKLGPSFVYQRWGRSDITDLLRWVLRQKQDTWMDRDFGLEKGKEE
jgi:hypothetical protein